jgi:S-adenosylhomocysteine hydrolase
VTASRIKDPGLSAEVEEAEIDWLRYVMPITAHYCREISQRDYRGKKLACWMHITHDNQLMMLALAESGAEIVCGACNVDSTNAAFLAGQRQPAEPGSRERGSRRRPVRSVHGRDAARD